MAPNDPDDNLPAGCVLRVQVQKTGRQIRYFEYLETGKRFFEKDDLLEYVRIRSSKRKKTRPRGSMNLLEHSGVKKEYKDDDSSKWLPDGWLTEFKTRKSGRTAGREYKVFIDPVTGNKFYSKPEVLNYLESVNKKELIPKQENTHTAAIQSQDTEVISSTDNDLPLGWIKDTRIRRTATGTRKESFYKDPVSGYTFRSKRSALHYLQTGEISIHAYKPAKSASYDEASTSTAAKRRKLNGSVTRRQLFEGEASLNVTSTELPEVKALAETQSKSLGAENNQDDGAPKSEVFLGKMITDKDTGTKEIINMNCAPFPESTTAMEYQGQSILADNLLLPSPNNSLQGQNSLGSKRKCSYAKSNYSGNSENKRKLNTVPRRYSKRLSGHEPEFANEFETLKCSVKSATATSCEREVIPAEGYILDDSDNKVFEQVKNRHEKEIANCTPSNANLQPDEVPWNKLEACRNLAISGEQLQTLESVISDDGKSHLFTPIGSSKSDLSPVSTPAVDVLCDKILPGTENGNISSRKSGNCSLRSSKKKLNMPCRSSKRLAGVKSEFVPDLMHNEQSRRGTNCNPIGSEASSTSLKGGVPQLLGPGYEKEVSHLGYSSEEKSQSPAAELSDKCEKDHGNQTDFEVQTQKLGTEDLNAVKPNDEPQNLEAEKKLYENADDIPVEAENMHNGNADDIPQKLEAEKIHDLNAEPEYFPFGDSWSDPCLEFAYKTLTGAIPVEDNFPIQEYLQDHERTASQTHRDSDTGLLDLGFPNSFDTDILFQFDAPEKLPASQQQFSAHQSFLPSGSLSTPGSCNNNIGPQQPCFEGNKEIHGKVKS